MILKQANDTVTRTSLRGKETARPGKGVLSYQTERCPAGALPQVFSGQGSADPQLLPIGDLAKVPQ